MRPFSDTSAVSPEALERVKSVLRRQGLPDGWAETPEFHRNLVRMFTALGPEVSALMLRMSDLATRLSPRLEALPYDSAGALMMLARMMTVPALDQPASGIEPAELYDPMAGYTPEYAYDCLDLTTHTGRFFFEHEREDGTVNEAAIDRALQAIVPDVVAIGSGPACGAALSVIRAQRPNAAFLVLDVGDYYTQADYDARTTTAVGIETCRAGAAQMILNGVGRVSVNFTPQVWGGGAEIFSGTAHHLPAWYEERLPMKAEDRKRHEAAIRQECRIARTSWSILSEAQKRFYRAAEQRGHAPYLLEGFGRGGDTGNGRCYAGKKERIPYIDNLFRQNDGVAGIANCRVDAVLRAPDGRVAALELSFISRRTRKVIATRTLELPSKVQVLLGAGSIGDQRILAQSGDALALERRTGVLHGYTAEIVALYDEPLATNGIPQGMGCEIVPEVVGKDGEVLRRVTLEGAHPGRPLLCAVGLAQAPDRMKAWEIVPRLASVGILFTESKPGMQLTVGDRDVTLQRLTGSDFARASLGLEASLRVWETAGAKAVGLNLPVRFPSKYKDLEARGMAGVDEIDALMRHVRKHPPSMLVFYRTGHRFGTINPENGEVKGFRGLHMVGEDAIPPGPSVNPTLAILMLARHYGEAVAARIS